MPKSVQELSQCIALINLYYFTCTVELRRQQRIKTGKYESKTVLGALVNFNMPLHVIDIV